MALKESSRRKRKGLSPRQMKLIKARAEGKTYAQAAIAAGYPQKNARQSGFQAMQQIRGRVPDLLDKHGLSEDTLIDKYLRPLLDAKETVFFQKDGKVKQRVNVAALGILLSSLRTAFELHGSYAPRDPKEAEHFGVKVIVVDMPRPPKHPQNAVIDVSGNGQHADEGLRMRFVSRGRWEWHAPEARQQRPRLKRYTLPY